MENRLERSRVGAQNPNVKIDRSALSAGNPVRATFDKIVDWQLPAWMLLMVEFAMKPQSMILDPTGLDAMAPKKLLKLRGSRSCSSPFS